MIKYVYLNALLSGSSFICGLKWVDRLLGLNSELMQLKFDQLYLNFVFFKISTPVVVSN